jgi:hypothetical protein
MFGICVMKYLTEIYITYSEKKLKNAEHIQQNPYIEKI